MNFLRYTLTICLLTFFAFTAQAQLQFGGGAATVANFNQFGVQARAQYQITENIRAAADFTYLFADFGSAWELNPNVHYIFKDDGAGQQFYGLAGLGVYNYSFDLGFGGILGDLGKTSVTDIGLNVGGGVNIPIGGMTGYAEAKYSIGGSELGIAVGVLFGGK